MKKNMGIIDRTVRTFLALTIVVLYFAGMINGVAAVILGAFAFIFLLTGFVGFCPLYAPLRFSTRKKTANVQVK